MTDKPIRIPGPDHPITIDRTEGRVVVTAAGRIIADSRAALTLREAGYDPVQYIPAADVDFGSLTRSDSSTYCPYKGDASYFSISGAAASGADAVWTYERPFDAVAAIKDHVAFYPDRVDAIDVRAD